MKKAVVLLSGGLDSATCLAMANAQGFACYVLSFDYGQRHHAELTAARQIASVMGALEHRVVALDIGQFGASALTDPAIAVSDFSGSEAIPATYVPARNTIFLAIALGMAEAVGAYDIFIGVNAVDYSGYPDCRPEFIDAFQQLAHLATKTAVEGQAFRFHAPLLSMTKAQIIQTGARLEVDYGLTVSCYRLNAKGEACGYCDSCVLRAKGFEAAKMPDPTHYVKDYSPQRCNNEWSK